MNAIGLKLVRHRALSRPTLRACRWSNSTRSSRAACKPLSLQVPRGKIWGRMSDHLPLIGEFGL
jgi:hypothetical protein